MVLEWVQHIVPMITALTVSKMQEGEFSVDNMKDCVVICAACVTVIIQRHLQVIHVHNIKTIGTNMSYNMGSNHYLGSADWSDAQQKNILHGFLLLTAKYSIMMKNILLKLKRIIILLHLISTV